MPWYGGVALAFAGAIALMAVIALRGRSRPARLPESGPTPNPPAPALPPGPDTPVGFGYKCAWIAVRSECPERVIEALRLKDVRRASWAEGVAGAHSRKVFVSPVVDGWVLAAGEPLGGVDDALHSLDALSTWLGGLSQRLAACVQYFATHRVVEAHVWALADGGRLLRAYGRVGDQNRTLYDEGEKTAAEKGLGLAFFDDRSPEAQTEAYWEREDLSFPDEGTVMTIAGKWSVDPTTLDGRTEPLGPGWLGWAIFPAKEPR